MLNARHARLIALGAPLMLLAIACSPRPPAGDGAAPADAAQSDASEASDKAPAPAAPVSPK